MDSFFHDHELLICIFLVIGCVYFAVEIADTFRWWDKDKEGAQ
jgi:hypothetical protein